MSDHSSKRRVVITGVGVISPLGTQIADVWQAVCNGVSGVSTLSSPPKGTLCIGCGAPAESFTGAIDQFGPLDKKIQRAIKKGQKLMCREIEMGVAAAQLALHDSGLTSEVRESDRTGVIFGSDYIMTLPDEFSNAIKNCVDVEDGSFKFDRWSQQGLPEVNPLWLLKYLPNMPASHIAIYNDLRGANNTLTLREASPGAAVAEATSTITRGHVDAMVVGATGTRINPFRILHASTQEILAQGDENPEALSRPFDINRTGSVLGEGAGVLILEELSFAEKRGAKILGEIVGFGSSTVGPEQDQFYRRAIGNALRSAVGTQAVESIGHINAHGISTPDGDKQEADAIVDVFGTDTPPVVAPKGNFGNLGAGSGIVEAIISLSALGEGHLWPSMNYESADPQCPINVVTSSEVPAGDCFVTVNVSPQGQATAFQIANINR